MFPRHIKTRIEEALLDTPAVYIAGPRQSGKSTLVKTINKPNQYQYSSLDDLNVLTSAKIDPKSFIDNLSEYTIIDEIQRAPEIMLPLKQRIDNHRIPGGFILTGSANILNLPNVADSLAGRMEIINLNPLSFSEKTTLKKTWIKHIFDTPLKDIFSSTSSTNSSSLNFREFIITGGYPDIQKKPSPARMAAWFDSYLRTLIERDIRDIIRLEETQRIKILLSHLATRSATTLNITDISRSSAIPNSTTTLYTDILKNIFLCSTIPAWFTNRGKRLTKSPKFFINDTGLLCHILSIRNETSLTQSREWGQIFETFIYTELLKQISFYSPFLSLFHYRTTSGSEIDFILEETPNSCFAIEVKTSKTISSSDFTPIKNFAHENPDLFKGGILIYQGDTPFFFENNIAAIPVSYLI